MMFQPIIVVAPGDSSPMPSSIARGAGFSILSMVFVPLVVLGIAGVVYFAQRSTLYAGAGLLAGGWSGQTPLMCGGNDSIEAFGISAVFSSGSAIEAGGNCHVKCTRCTLKAPVAISAGGNAQILLVDSHVEGAQTGVSAGGNAEVKFLGNSTLEGTVSRGGNAQVMAPPEPVSRAPAAVAAPAPAPAPVPEPHHSPSSAAPPRGPVVHPPPPPPHP
jgi:hypothetical protein